jgi:glycosyltransferase involved in cell wall biosynthesis
MTRTDLSSHRPAAAVDVIMRTKNRMNLLPRAIASLRAQTFAGWNLILVDSGDHAATSRWLAEHPGPEGERILHLAIAPGPMMGELSNIGIRHGSAPLIVLLDDDDTWDPEFLAVTCPLLRSRANDSTFRGVVTRTMLVHEEWQGGQWLETGRDELNPRLTRVTLPLLAAVNRFTTNSFVYERAAWEQLGGYNQDMPVLDDWDFNLRFLLRWDIACVPSVRAFWHRRPATGAATDNSAAADHEFETAAYINRHIRAGLDSPLAALLFAGELHRVDMENQARMFGKIKSMSDKVGKIDSRTKKSG